MAQKYSYELEWCSNKCHMWGEGVKGIAKV